MSVRNVVWIVCIVVTTVPTTIAKADSTDSFSRDVAPILVKRCLECHNERDASAKLILSDKAAVFKGGESGPAIVPGKLDKSLLIEKIRSGEMPPPKRGHSQKLSAAEVTILQNWVTDGAAWPDGRKLDLYEATNDVRGGRDWWSLQPVRRPVVPAIDRTARSYSAIDAFIQSRLNEQGMQPAPAADRPTLIRRLYHDLLGLPPSYEEIREFESDQSPDACERLVDRLLSSPHFGERQGRLWLDLVRYADTCGYERDQEKPYAWKYRDWVIAAINSDLPWNQFVLEQLAGDELPDRTESAVIATGLLRLGTWNDEPNDADEYKYERLEDMVHVTSTAFLGLTVKCARCHDHKFDPIPQTDYYRMAAAFWPGAIEPRGRELLGGPTRDELGFDVMGWTDIRQPPPLHLLRKGEHKHPLGVVEPGHLTLIPAIDRPLEPAPLGARTTHRRRQLAEWIASPDNPLTPRVLVNRLWMNHFGSGLVRSADNFGFTGDKPTHPELLDWLAAEVSRQENPLVNAPIGSAATRKSALKSLHRLLVTSFTYRQASLHPKQDLYAAQDAGNRFWWRAERRRIDSESLRDRMLIVADDLDTRMSGPGFKPTIQAEALEGLSRKEGAWKPSPVVEQRRRAVYMFSQRSLLPPLMTTFDFVDTTLPCVQRPVSTVAPQALALLNNSFAHERSAALAERVLREDFLTSTGGPSDSHIRRAWQIGLGRDPSKSEIDAARSHLRQQTTRFESTMQPQPSREIKLPVNGRVLHLMADAGVQVDADGRVESWNDQSGQSHHASQSAAAHRPLLVKNAIHGLPTLRLDGQKRFLKVAGQVVTSPAFAVFAVVSDQSATNQHREIFSNWNGAVGNSGTSLFLGMTGADSVRLSDEFSGVGKIESRSTPFLLSGFSGSTGISVQQNGRELASRAQGLSPRNLKTDYVIGQQGNIDGEYWHGDIAELLVYDRELKETERQAVTQYLTQKYNLPWQQVREQHRSAYQLALTSLCHVLMNTNEFVYVD